MKSEKKFGIIGAGPSGLAMSLFLKDSAEILERESHPGGHASSFVKDGFTLDYGPHIMFSKNQAILDFMVKSLNGNSIKCRRNNKISFKNCLIKYPFENDLKSLPLEDNFACLKGFFANPYKEKFPDPKNMKEWMLKTFGEGICELYLFPYNEKVWNIPIEQLSMAWANRIPNPPPDDIIKSAIGYETEGYVHQLHYHYPKQGGYQAISDAWAKVCPVRYGFDVKSISPTSHGTFIVSNGSEEIEYPGLISTMPIQILAKALQMRIPDEVTEAIQNLIVNPMYIASFGIRGIDQNQFTAIYFPESDYWVNRISYPCTFSAENGPKGHYSIQAELTCTADSDTWKKSDKEIMDHIRNGLLQRGIISDPSQIVMEDLQRKDYSYVVYNMDYEKNATIIRNWFSSQNIHLVGRFSYFEYVNVDMAIERALQTASALNGSMPSDQNAILESALDHILRQTNH